MTVTILTALRDPKLLGASPAFAAPETWRPWRSFLGAAYGLPVEDLPLYRGATGRPRYAPPEGGFREAVAVVGRQAGKTRIGAAVVAFEAATAPPCRDGELYALLLAQDHRSAVRTAFSYIKSLFEASPLLRRMIVRQTADTLELENGMRVAAYPCRPPAVRGLRARVAVLDELAFYIGSDARRTDEEMLRAVRPTLATTGGRLIVLSSPYGQTGSLWELHRRHHGRMDSDTLVWQATAPMMNPTLPRDYLERMRQDDPEAARAEIDGEFRRGLATLLDPDALDACVRHGRRDLPPAEETVYRAFVDPSGGRRDAFTCAIGHRAEERAVVDVVRAWPAPFNPEGVIAECVDLLRRYRIKRVTGDRYGGEHPREQFRKHGVEYDVAERDRSGLYLELLPHVNSASVEVPDDSTLLRELRGLERRRGPSGRDRVDHRPGAHDDRANSAAGVLYLLMRHRSHPLGPMDLSQPGLRKAPGTGVDGPWAHPGAGRWSV